MFLLNNLFYLLSNYYELFIEGLVNTLIVAIVGTLGGMILGMIVLLMRMQVVNEYDNKLISIVKRVVKRIAVIYVDILRGTPMMVQGMIFFYGVASKFNMDPMIAALIIISFNTAAYISEIIRSGVNGLGNGAFEAAHSLGMSRFQTLVYVVYPQVIKNSIPALLNELIVNVKDSSVLSVIGFSELFYSAKAAASQTYMNTDAFILVGIMYFIITFVLTRVITYISNRYFSTERKALNVSNINKIENVKGVTA